MISSLTIDIIIIVATIGSFLLLMINLLYKSDQHLLRSLHSSPLFDFVCFSRSRPMSFHHLLWFLLSIIIVVIIIVATIGSFLHLMLKSSSKETSTPQHSSPPFSPLICGNRVAYHSAPPWSIILWSGSSAFTQQTMLLMHLDSLSPLWHQFNYSQQRILKSCHLYDSPVYYNHEKGGRLAALKEILVLSPQWIVVAEWLFFSTGLHFWSPRLNHLSFFGAILPDHSIHLPFYSVFPPTCAVFYR